jgi:heterotetrameric sarcosine oxidase delta subunit
MSFALTCPNCGLRPVAEFRWGGERRPESAPPPAHLHERLNLDGPQEEWWFHRLGCRRWFLARRDTRDNAVQAVWWPDEAEPEGSGTDGR